MKMIECSIAIEQFKYSPKKYTKLNFKIIFKKLLTTKKFLIYFTSH